MIDLAAIADGLVRTDAGFWETRNDAGEVIFYPAGDTGSCFGVEESSFWFAHRNDVIAAAVKRFPPCGAIFASNEIARKLLARLFAGESRAVARGRSIPFGTSILAVARATGVEPGILLV